MRAEFVMPVWQVVLLLNLTLAVGLGLGYGVWGHRLAALDGELKGVQTKVERLERELQACAAGARVGEQQWEGRGIVRAIYPRLFLITHEEIVGLLSARTTGFRVAASANDGRARVGDPIRFWLHGTGTDSIVLVRMEPW